jgi:RimJ/RimL family protein N-acetyltransferase
MTPLRTERLILRPFQLEDAPFILRLFNEPSFIENITDKGVRHLEQAEDYLREGPLASYATHGHGLWMVQHRETGNPMGMCGLIKRDRLPELDLGYALCPEFWGLGYAREAAAACLAWGRATLGLQGILAIVTPGNAASIRLLEALEFQRTGTMTYAPGDEVEVYRLAFV